MKKIIIIFILMVAGTGVLSQQTYFLNDTIGTVTKRLTCRETGNFGTTYMTAAKNLTILGYATVDITFSFGDSLFAAKTSQTFPSGSPILVYLVQKTQYTMIWLKGASAGSCYLQTRVY
jgi:hypothetical protein